jgi:hypothetical protein
VILVAPLHRCGFCSGDQAVANSAAYDREQRHDTSREATTPSSLKVARSAYRSFCAPIIKAQLPVHVIIAADDLGDVLFYQGSPRADEEILTGATPEDRAREAFAGVAQRVVVCGRTHAI